LSVTTGFVPGDIRANTEGPDAQVEHGLRADLGSGCRAARGSVSGLRAGRLTGGPVSSVLSRDAGRLPRDRRGRHVRRSVVTGRPSNVGALLHRRTGRVSHQHRSVHDYVCKEVILDYVS